MRRLALALLLFGLFLCLSGPGRAQQKLVADFRKVGGVVKVGGVKDGGAIIHLTLSNDKVTDAALAPLKELTKLQKLSVNSPNVTDAGLTSLKTLTKLQELDLHGTPITDGTLDQVKGLTELKTL